MFDRFVLSLVALRQLETLYPVQFICFYKYVTGNVLRSFIAFIFVDSTRVTLHDSNQGLSFFLILFVVTYYFILSVRSRYSSCAHSQSRETEIAILG